MQASNRLICRSGTNDLREHFHDNPEVAYLTLVDGCSEEDLSSIRGNIRGQLITGLTLHGQSKAIQLDASRCKTIASLDRLRSFSLNNVKLEAQNLHHFTKLTHLSLDSVDGAMGRELYGTIAKLTNLRTLHVDQPLGEKELKFLFPLEHLETLDVEFSDSSLPLKVADTLPALRFVRRLPQFTGIPNLEEIQKFFKSLHFTPTFLLKRAFSLQDASKHDLFFYARSHNMDVDPIIKFVNPETAATEHQLLEWLHFAIGHADRRLFDRFISYPMAVNRPLSNGKLALIEAVKGQCMAKSEDEKKLYLQFCEKLLAMGANPDLPDSEGDYPLLLATLSHDKRLVELLLDANANPDLEIPAFPELQEKAQDTPFSSNKTFTLLQMACLTWFRNHSESPPIAESALEIAKVLIKRGADVLMANAEGQTLLHLIMMCKSPFPTEVVTRILYGASSTIKAKDGLTPLRYLLKAIHDLSIAKCSDMALWEAKFGYLKAIIEAGDQRITDFSQLYDIAKVHGVVSVLDFLNDRVAKQKKQKTQS